MTGIYRRIPGHCWGSAGRRTLLGFFPKIRVYSDANDENKGVLGSFGKTGVSHRSFIFAGGQRRLIMGGFVLLGTWAGCGPPDWGLLVLSNIRCDRECRC